MANRTSHCLASPLARGPRTLSGNGRVRFLFLRYACRLYDCAYISRHTVSARSSYRHGDPDRSAEPALLGLSSRERAFSSATRKSISARTRGVSRISGCTPSLTVLEGSGRGGSMRINAGRRSASTRGRTAIASPASAVSNPSKPCLIFLAPATRNNWRVFNKLEFLILKSSRRPQIRNPVVVWRHLYIQGRSPQEAAEQAAVSAYNTQSAADRLRKR
jgi:hypothetical protein